MLDMQGKQLGYHGQNSTNVDQLTFQSCSQLTSQMGFINAHYDSLSYSQPFKPSLLIVVVVTRRRRSFSTLDGFESSEMAKPVKSYRSDLSERRSIDDTAPPRRSRHDGGAPRQTPREERETAADQRRRSRVSEQAASDEHAPRGAEFVPGHIARDSVLHVDGFEGVLWRDVLRENARKEFEAARFETDPEIVTRLLIGGSDAVSSALDKLAEKQKEMIERKTRGEQP